MEEFRTAVAVHPNQPLDAMAASFSRLMTRHDELVLLFQAFAAANKPETMALGRQQLGKMYTYVAEVSGASDDELRVFFAHGMLMAVAATMRLPEIAGECPWAKNLSEMKKPGALALLHTSVHSEQT
jgi:hypothetical protein